MRKASGLLVAGCLVAGGTLVVMDTAEVGDEYSEYASTLVSQGAFRANQLVSDSVRWTIIQNGVLGAGLGSATQGKYYVSNELIKAWQEDGVSRLFMELGIPGVVLILFALYFLARALWQAVCWVPNNNPIQPLQLGLLSVGAANAASFAISHQQYSGDPVALLFATVLVGIVLGAPRVYAMQLARLQQQLQGRAVRGSSDSAPAPPPPLASAVP
jgi:hypothetical protein